MIVEGAFFGKLLGDDVLRARQFADIAKARCTFSKTSSNCTGLSR
jgi:hypothetical protein